MPLFEVLEFPFCKVLMTERWNEPPHRYFIGYRASNDFRTVIGLPVIDEFATFSSPIFFASTEILGKIYNAGISLGHLRDGEMNIDTGWPPLCIGTNSVAPALPDRWEHQLVSRLQSFTAPAKGSAKEVEGFSVQRVEIDGIDVFATNAPLLPKQLTRICEISERPFTIALATGNRVIRSKTGAPISIQAVSEAHLLKLRDKLLSY